MTSDLDCRTWPWNMTVDHALDHGLRPWPRSMTSEHDMGTWPQNNNSQHELEALTVHLNWEPECNASKVSSISDLKAWKANSVQINSKIGSSKELDSPTSVPVISAIISSSLNTLMSKSSEPTSKCANQRSMILKLSNVNLILHKTYTIYQGKEKAC